MASRKTSGAASASSGRMSASDGQIPSDSSALALVRISRTTAPAWSAPVVPSAKISPSIEPIRATPSAIPPPENRGVTARDPQGPGHRLLLRRKIKRWVDLEENRDRLFMPSPKVTCGDRIPEHQKCFFRGRQVPLRSRPHERRVICRQPLRQCSLDLRPRLLNHSTHDLPIRIRSRPSAEKAQRRNYRGEWRLSPTGPGTPRIPSEAADERGHAPPRECSESGMTAPTRPQPFPMLRSQLGGAVVEARSLILSRPDRALTPRRRGVPALSRPQCPDRQRAAAESSAPAAQQPAPTPRQKARPAEAAPYREAPNTRSSHTRRRWLHRATSPEPQPHSGPRRKIR